MLTRFFPGGASFFTIGIFTPPDGAQTSMKSNPGMTFAFLAALSFVLLRFTHTNVITVPPFGLPYYAAVELARLGLACVIGLGVTALMHGLKS